MPYLFVMWIATVLFITSQENIRPKSRRDTPAWFFVSLLSGPIAILFYIAQLLLAAEKERLRDK